MLVIQLLVKALPIEEGDYLRIIWPITPSIQFYKESPCHYLSHLIGHEGEGSIFHIIKELGKFISCLIYSKYSLSSFYFLIYQLVQPMTCLNFATVGWAMNLMAGESTDSTEYSFFSISMRLTDAGHGLFSLIVVYLNQHNYFNLNHSMFFLSLLCPFDLFQNTWRILLD